MKRRAPVWRAGVAACAAICLAAGQAAAQPSQWVLKSGGLWVSDRTFVMALSVRKREPAREGAKEEAARRAAEQFRRLRERLLLAVAASRAGLERDPGVRRDLEEFRTSHLSDLWVAEKVVAPARQAARAQAGQPGHGAAAEAALFREERARRSKQAAADAAREFPAEIDEERLAAAARGEGGDAAVARAAGREITASRIVAGMARVDHPSDRRETSVNVARTVLVAEIDRARYAALAEREGFAKRPDFIDDFGEQALRVLAAAYTAQKVNAGVSVAEADVAAAYERGREGLRRGEEREIYEILVPTREAADAIAARLAAGADFAAEVAAHSISPTKEKGGFFGFLQAGEAVPALDQAIMALKAGQTSPVVRSGYGYHLLRCAGVRTGRVPPLEEARPALERRLLEERRAQALAAALARLEQEIPVEVNETRYQEILKSL